MIRLCDKIKYSYTSRDEDATRNTLLHNTFIFFWQFQHVFYCVFKFSCRLQISISENEKQLYHNHIKCQHHQRMFFYVHNTLSFKLTVFNYRCNSINRRIIFSISVITVWFCSWASAICSFCEIAIFSMKNVDDFVDVESQSDWCWVTFSRMNMIKRVDSSFVETKIDMIEEYDVRRRLLITKIEDCRIVLFNVNFK